MKLRSTTNPRKRTRSTSSSQDSEISTSSLSSSLFEPYEVHLTRSTTSNASTSRTTSPVSDRAMTQSEVNQVVIEVQLISNEVMDELNERNDRAEVSNTEQMKSDLKVEQCRVVLDPIYDEVTTVFHMTPRQWEHLNSQRCWFCCKGFHENPVIAEPVPCAISMQWIGDRQVRFTVDGSFCNFACSKAWSNDFFSNQKGASGDPSRSMFGKTERNANAFLYRAWTSNSLQMYMDMPEALPRRLLSAFGGPMTYEDYLYHNDCNKDARTTLVTRKHLPYPMISCRQLLLEETTIQEMRRNLSSEMHMHTARVALPPADLLLRKRIQHLQSRGGNLNQNEGF